MKKVSKENLNHLKNLDWKNLPPPDSFKNTVIGRSLFTKEDIEVLNLKEGFYSIISTSQGSLVDKINSSLCLYILSKDQVYLINVY